MEKIVHFGAGNIGRGLIAPLMQATNYHIVFTDVNKPVINRLSEEKQYTVSYWDNSTSTIVNNFSVIYDVESKAFSDLFNETEIVTTAVTPKGLESVANVIVKLLKNRLTKKAL